MALDIKSRKTSDVIVVDLSGRLDVLGPTLSPKITELIERGERHFVMNLTGLEYIDAKGLGQLVTIYSAVRKAGGSLIVMYPREHIRKLLATTKLDTVFHIYEGCPVASDIEKSADGGDAHL